MVNDEKMQDVVADPSKTVEEPTAIESATSAPPLEAAAQRLDRLLGGGGLSEDRPLDFYTNPVKVVRRWLGARSGAAKEATITSIKSASLNLLDPSGPCVSGRSLLLSLSGPEAMDSDVIDKPSIGYVSKSAAREVEAWLISLAVRLLWKDAKYAEAADLVEKGIAIVISHIEESSLRITSSSAGSAASLFPLLARLYRFRSLIYESLESNGINLRIDTAKAHNLATVRRDVDTQATLLNCMLRDLLLTSQGKLKILVPQIMYII
jgi:hypothetical protein